MPRPAKRSFTIGGHRTSISLEAQFWDALKAIAKAEGKAVAQIVFEIDQERDDGGGLSSAVRIWILLYVQQKAGFLTAARS